MDFNKVSAPTILYAVTAIVAVIVAIAVRYGCLAGSLDAGTANLVFIVVLGIEAVLYLLLIKGIIGFVNNWLAKRNKRKAGSTGASIPAEESVHDRIVREKFEESIAAFCEYTAKVLGRHIPAEELQRLDGYIKCYACELWFDVEKGYKTTEGSIWQKKSEHKTIAIFEIVFIAESSRRDLRTKCGQKI